MPIRINPFFFLWPVLLMTQLTDDLLLIVLGVGVMMGSIFVHELGHAIAAKACGCDVMIEFTALGGLTYYKGPILSFWQRLGIVVAGPAAGFALWGFLKLLLLYVLPLGIFFDYPRIGYLTGLALVVNWYWNLFNLLPVYPLDGGQITRLTLEYFFGLRGLKAAIVLSLFIAAMLVVYGFQSSQWFLAMIFLMYAFDSAAAWQQVRYLRNEDRNPGRQDEYKAAIDAAARGFKADAKERFEHIRETGKTGLLKASATEQLAQILSEQGELEKAYQMLLEIENKLSPSSMPLFQRLAYLHKDYAKAITVGIAATRVSESMEVSTINALAEAQLGHAHACVGWLKSAERCGQVGFKDLLAKSEFAAVKDDKAFQAFAKRYL